MELCELLAAHALFGDEQDACGDYEDATDDVEDCSTDTASAGKLSSALVENFDLIDGCTVLLQSNRCCLGVSVIAFQLSKVRSSRR